MGLFEPKVKKMNKFIKTITFGNVKAITFAPFGIYIKEDYFYLQERAPFSWNELVNHENIH